MIHDLDRSLEVLLSEELAAFGADAISISFAAPDSNFSARLPAIDMFLYALQENLELRGNDEFVTVDEGRREATRRSAPVRIDASYLVTAWPGSSADPIRDEHRLLGAAMVALLRHRRLPQKYLRGDLAKSLLALPTTAMQTSRLQSMGEFWQAIGGRPKAALHYMVTLPVDAFSSLEPAPLVLDRIFDVKALPPQEAAP
ncbi:DUF4255 domain-containing protein [Ideonella sp. YS5]|uniref:DUF4255 domain-containing protein n=1 Tax=Ideonella sp. YS5 TaxID=3453714 RepID=UPI003EED8A28